MPRGTRKEITYTGEAAKIYKKIQELEEKLAEQKAALKVAYKEQLRAEKEAERKAKKEAAIVAKKELQAKKAALLKAIENSGKSPDEIMELLNQ